MTFQSLINTLLEILFPSNCILCNAPNSLLCTHHNFPKYTDKRTLEGIKEVFIAYAYDKESGINTVIEQYKYHHMYLLKTPLAERLYDIIPAYIWDKKPVITAIPVHYLRYIWRGYNQSALLSKELSKLSHMPYKPLLSKVKHTKQQALLTQEERYTNVLNAYKYNKNEGIYDTVILVDDVITTGTSMKEAAKTLINSGVKEVYAVCIAGSKES